MVDNRYCRGMSYPVRVGWLVGRYFVKREVCWKPSRGLPEFVRVLITISKTMFEFLSFRVFCCNCRFIWYCDIVQVGSPGWCKELCARSALPFTTPSTVTKFSSAHVNTCGSLVDQATQQPFSAPYCNLNLNFTSVYLKLNRYTRSPELVERC
jgi:hypothetical protein